MEPIFIILFLILVFSSLTISFVGIYQISTHKFKAHKLTWILICMIGIIGPILYLTIGRKLLIKKK